MRSLLIATADGTRLAEALKCGADAVVVDLAEAPPAGRAAGRAAAARFFKEARGLGLRPSLIVRASGLDSGETDADLDAVMGGAPDAILLPGSLGGASVQALSVKLAVREAAFALTGGSTRIIAVAGAAQSLFGMASYRGSSARLCAIGWSAESLRADLRAESDRDPSRAYLGPYRLARDLTLIAAASAGVAAIDAAFADPNDEEGLRAEALAARRLGFAGKMALGAAQASIINEVFGSRPTPPARL